MARKRIKRCRVCIEKLKDGKWCMNVAKCPIAKKHKKMRELLEKVGEKNV